jgi:hypothetical protein
MEFVREEPLEGVLRRRIAAALRSVEGVETADEMDRKVWFVTGIPSGAALVRPRGPSAVTSGNTTSRANLLPWKTAWSLS